MDETTVDETTVDETTVDEKTVDETTVDETGVDETGVDEMVVDKTGVDQLGCYLGHKWRIRIGVVIMSQEYTKPGRLKNQGTQFLVVTQHNLISTLICQSQIMGSY